ncbi:hypothetical protein KJ707_02695 [Patescibacteria group bacterium]|nr:hypothetical protein [Patescibacteria group bacterium]MBU1967317.1 hypothetical protein [Patescibacteria group bacterium]MBU2543446.1 hypothetical protein [Patescibacteria group bacterium]
MKQSDAQDQTQFITESPLYEKPTARQEPQQPLLDDEKTPNNKEFPKKIVLAIGICLLLLVLGAVFIKSRQSSPGEKNILLDDSPLDKAISGPLEQRVQELSQELELADPSQEKLPFPLVEIKINLEDE